MFVTISRIQSAGNKGPRYCVDGDAGTLKSLIGNWESLRDIAERLKELDHQIKETEGIDIALYPTVDVKITRLGSWRLYPLSDDERDEFWSELSKLEAVAA
jgi:hypothetical protein